MINDKIASDTRESSMHDLFKDFTPTKFYNYLSRFRPYQDREFIKVGGPVYMLVIKLLASKFFVNGQENDQFCSTCFSFVRKPRSHCTHIPSESYNKYRLMALGKPLDAYFHLSAMLMFETEHICHDHLVKRGYVKYIKIPMINQTHLQDWKEKISNIKHSKARPKWPIPSQKQLILKLKIQKKVRLMLVRSSNSRKRK